MIKKVLSVKGFVDFVSQDKDQRGEIKYELKCQEEYKKDWGFILDKN